ALISQLSSPSHPRVCLNETKKSTAISTNTVLARTHSTRFAGLGKVNLALACCFTRQAKIPKPKHAIVTIACKRKPEQNVPHIHRSSETIPLPNSHPRQVHSTRLRRPVRAKIEQ